MVEDVNAAHTKKASEKEKTGQGHLWDFERKNWVILSEVYSTSGSAMTKKNQGEKIFQMILGWNADNRRMALLSEKLRWRLGGTCLALEE